MQEQTVRLIKRPGKGRPGLNEQGSAERVTVCFDHESYEWLMAHPDGLHEVVRRLVMQERTQQQIAS